MLDDLILEATQHLETTFYEEKFYFSYSSINKLLFSPQAFYQTYILKYREERTEKYLMAGRVIHCLLLNEEDFERDYLVSPASLPTGKTKELIDAVYFKSKQSLEMDEDLTLEDCEEGILESMIALNYYQKIIKDTDRLVKVVTPETKSYWEFLKKKGNKELLDEGLLQYCRDSVEVIKGTPGIMELLGKDGAIREVHNEILLQAELPAPNEKFGIKGILDNLVIDHQKKEITINDFKTSAKSLKDFSETVEFYNYWLQAVMYIILVESNYKHLIDRGYQLKFNFIVIDKYSNVYAFPLTAKTLIEWNGRFLLTLDTVKYHYENNRYGLPHAFDIGSITL